ncbi:hypothetical protein [Mesorhizobium sp. M0633]|uniref:hypothetical protein n=1 Tax=Mesorhizobium sp. M0633 TaxID=2956977 RepID=UPI00333D0868
MLDDGSIEITFAYHNSDEAILKAIRQTSSTACASPAAAACNPSLALQIPGDQRKVRFVQVAWRATGKAQQGRSSIALSGPGGTSSWKRTRCHDNRDSG